MPNGIEYHVRAILEAEASAASTAKIQGWARSVQAASQRVEAFGKRIAGTAATTALSFAKIGASAVAAAGAFGMVALVKGGIEFNRQLEQMKYSMAATLQLMGHAQGDFIENLGVAEEVQRRLFLIAAKSPASFEQASQMFTNMLPGARAVQGDMEQILDLAKESLALGMIMGGDFQTTGAQLSRILTGGAGAEFETWKVLQKPILEAGKAAGVFADNLSLGTKLTEQFNRLRPDQRWELVRAATEKLAVATEAFGETWAGVTSTIQSDVQVLKRSLTAELFEGLKGEFKLAVGKGGVLDPEGKTMARLQEAAAALGHHLGRLSSAVVRPLVLWVEDFAANWRAYLDSAFRWVDTFWNVVKAFAKVAVIRTAVGGAVAGIGKLGGMLVGMGQGFGTLAQVMGSAATAALWLAPVVAALGLAFGGVAAIAGGVAAFIASKWDEIVGAVRSGAVTLEPVFAAIDSLWARLKALGQAMLGTTSTTEGAQKIVNLFAKGIDVLMGIMSAGLRVIGAVVAGWNMLQVGVQTIYDMFLGMIHGILKAVSTVLDALPGMSDKAAEAKQALGTLAEHRANVRRSINEDVQDATRLFEWADAFDNARVEASSALTEGLRQGVQSFVAGPAAKPKDIGGEGIRGRAGAAAPPTAGRTVRVEKMIVNQDLRGMDPDRVIGAFYREVERAIEKRTGSLALEEMGV